LILSLIFNITSVFHYHTIYPSLVFRPVRRTGSRHESAATAGSAYFLERLAFQATQVRKQTPPPATEYPRTALLICSFNLELPIKYSS
jgi:predicted Zn-dependent peptidase